MKMQITKWHAKFIINYLKKKVWWIIERLVHICITVEGCPTAGSTEFMEPSNYAPRILPSIERKRWLMRVRRAPTRRGACARSGCIIILMRSRLCAVYSALTRAVRPVKYKFQISHPRGAAPYFCRNFVDLISYPIRLHQMLKPRDQK